MKKLDFVIVGTFKSATSTVAFELGQHPEVNLPAPKDPYIFLKSFCEKLTQPPEFIKRHRASAVLTEDKFDQSFSSLEDSGLFGEATPLYLYKYDEAIKGIKLNNPKMKIIIILRDPCERAFSNYSHNVKDGFEKRTFSEVIENYMQLETDAIHPFFHYINAGFYSKQVAEYKKSFEDVLIILYDQFCDSPHKVMCEICNFLRIKEPDLRSNYSKLNKTGRYKSKWLQSFIVSESSVKKLLRPLYRFLVSDPTKRKRYSEAVKNLNIQDIQMSDEDKSAIKAIFSDDVRKLSQYLKVDLSRKWRA